MTPPARHEQCGQSQARRRLCRQRHCPSNQRSAPTGPFWPTLWLTTATMYGWVTLDPSIHLYTQPFIHPLIHPDKYNCSVYKPGYYSRLLCMSTQAQTWHICVVNVSEVWHGTKPLCDMHGTLDQMPTLVGWTADGVFERCVCVCFR